MYKLVKPLEVWIALACVLTLLSFILSSHFPNFVYVACGLMIGIAIGSSWAESSYKWMDDNRKMISGYSFVEIDGKPHNRTSLFYKWAILKLLFWAFLLAGVIAWGYSLSFVLNLITGVSWYLKLPAIIIFAIVSTFLVVAPIFIFKLLTDRLKFFSELAALIEKAQKTLKNS